MDATQQFNLDQKDVDQPMFAKIDPKLLEKKLDFSEHTFRERIDRVDDYTSLSNIVTDTAS